MSHPDADLQPNLLFRKGESQLHQVLFAVCCVAGLQGELLLRTEELRDALWAICDAKNEEAEAARTKLANDGSAAEHVALLGQHMTSLVQVELDRWTVCCQLANLGCGVVRHDAVHEHAALGVMRQRDVLVECQDAVVAILSAM